MMRDEDKPFVCYRRGRWSMKIEPRGAEGWRLMGMWCVPFLLLTGGHVWLVSGLAGNDALINWTTLGFVVLTVLWAIAMIRWMLARAEVINLDDLLALKRAQDQDKRR